MVKLPDGELIIMQALWKLGKTAERTEIENALEKNNKIATTTVLTILSRLAKKKYIKVEKHGKTNTYSALVSEEEYQRNQCKDFLSRIFKNDISEFASALCHAGLSEEEIAELKKSLKNHHDSR